MSTKTKNEVCPTCKRATRESFRPTKHAKVKATYGHRGSVYYSSYMDKYKTATQHHFPAFKAKVNQAPFRMRGGRYATRTYMSCPDPWHDDQHEKSIAESEARIDARENAEENRKKFLAERKQRKEEAAVRRKEKAILHKQRQKRR